MMFIGRVLLGVAMGQVNDGGQTVIATGLSVTNSQGYRADGLMAVKRHVTTGGDSGGPWFTGIQRKACNGRGVLPPSRHTVLSARPSRPSAMGLGSWPLSRPRDCWL